MILNYIKTALYSLFRNKTYSIIVLFGITFTFAIISVIASIYAQLFGSGYPENAQKNTLYLTEITETNKQNNFSKKGGISLVFAKELKERMKSTDIISYISLGENIYLSNNGKEKLKVKIKYTDTDFWNATSFNFEEGTPYNDLEYENNNNVIVITNQFRKNFFGKGSALKKRILIKNISYEIVGVVNECSSFKTLVYSDIYILNSNKKSIKSDTFVGNFKGVFIAKNDIQSVKNEYYNIVQEKNNSEKNKIITSNINSILEAYSRNIFGDIYNDGISKFYTVLILFAIIFLLLPAINLINLIFARTSERYMEIAVRKSFGASSKHIIYQFIFENILINLIGAILSLLVSLVLLYILNHFFFKTINLKINSFVVITTIIVSICFAIISGFLPAYRLSKINPMQILKNN